MAVLTVSPFTCTSRGRPTLTEISFIFSIRCELDGQTLTCDEISSDDCPGSQRSYTITGFRLCCGRVSNHRNEFMKIHEYQAKSILSKYGVAIPRGEVASSREEAEAVAKKLFSEGATGVVVKAQIHAGGRGKGGGVKIAKSVEE